MERSTSLIDKFTSRSDSESQERIAMPFEAGNVNLSSANTILEGFETKKSAAATNAVPDAILQIWGIIARTNISVRMYGDLVRLASAPSGWNGPASRSLRANSVKMFLEFWSSVSDDAVEPELTLSTDGSLHAEWFESPRKRLDIRFAEKNTFFGLFSSSNVLEGVDAVGSVAQVLKLHHAKPLRWSAR